MGAMDGDESRGRGRIPVVPDVLVWARESAGFDLEEASRRLSPSVAKWETGDLQPTVKQLRDAAKLYKRPLAVLLLPKRPTDFLPLRDFRRPGDNGRDQRWSPALHAEFKRAISQRDVMLELAEVSPSSIPPPVQLPSFEVGSPVEEVGSAFRRLLDLESIPPRTWGDPNAALAACVAAIEALGVLVVQTQRVAIAEMRGFSISGWPTPVIALNGSDSPRGRLFTLFHELTHLSLTVGGICDLHEIHGQRDGQDEVEHFCNQVAAATLMPAIAVLSQPSVRAAGRDRWWTLDELAQLGHGFGASAEALLLRLIALGKATWDLYWTQKPEIESRYAAIRESERERRKETSGGPSYYVVKARDLGHGYVNAVIDAFQSRSISSLDAVDYLEVRFDALPKLQAAAHA